MSTMEIDLTAQQEADAARAANNGDNETVHSEEDPSGSDVDYIYDDEDQKAAQAETNRLEEEALKEMLTNNGYALREILKSEKVKAHFVSPFSEENEMSIEDILGEIPKEDLHEVGTSARLIYMPASFVQKWIIPTIRVRNALKEHGPEMPGGMATAMLFSIFDQSKLDMTEARPSRDERANELRALAKKTKVLN